MSTKCFINGCENRRNKTTLKQFFNIPRPEKRRREWIVAAGFEPENHMKTQRLVCEDHFPESDFVFKDKNGRRSLKLTAIPTRYKVKAENVNVFASSSTNIQVEVKVPMTNTIPSTNQPMVRIYENSPLTLLEAEPNINASFQPSSSPPIITLLNGRPVALTPAIPGSSGLMPNNQWITQPTDDTDNSLADYSLASLNPITPQSAQNLQLPSSFLPSNIIQQSKFVLQPSGEWVAQPNLIGPVDAEDDQLIVPDFVNATTITKVDPDPEPDPVMCISDDEQEVDENEPEEEQQQQQEVNEVVDGEEIFDITDEDQKILIDASEDREVQDPSTSTDHLQAAEEYELTELTDEESLIVYELTKKAIYKNSYHYLGLSYEFIKLIDMIVQSTLMAERDLLLILRKCKQNESFKTLGDYFGVSELTAEQIFTENVSIVATGFRKFIFWPNTNYVQKNLPLEFKLKYNKTQTIIVCHKVIADEPNARPINYILSYTPYGFVNFVSTGYSDDINTTDTEIVKQCGFLDNVKKGVHILVRDGFERLDEEIQQRGGILHRAKIGDCSKFRTIEEENAYMNVQVVRTTIDQMCNRMLRYQLLKPHTVDPSLMYFMDDVVLIVAALLNIKAPHIRLVPRDQNTTKK